MQKPKLSCWSGPAACRIFGLECSSTSQFFEVQCLDEATRARGGDNPLNLDGRLHESEANRQRSDARAFRAAEHSLSYAAIERARRNGLGPK